MQFYLRIHQRGMQTCIGVCDEECLGRELREGKIRFKVSKYFFEGDLVDIKKALQILESSNNYNIVGKEICQAMIDSGFLHRDSIMEIEGIPIAIKIAF